VRPPVRNADPAAVATIAIMRRRVRSGSGIGRSSLN
jgi:hypothetical protein